MKTNEKELLTTQEFADRLKVNARTVRRWIKNGKIEPSALLPSGHYRFRAEQVEELLQRPSLSERATDIAAHVQVTQEKMRRLRRVI